MDKYLLQCLLYGLSNSQGREPLQFAIPVITATGGIGDKNPLWLSDHIQRLRIISRTCSPGTQPSQSNPKSSKVERKTPDLQTQETSPIHPAFSPFSTLSLPWWELEKDFIPLSLTPCTAHLPQLWLLLRAFFYSASSWSLFLCCSHVHLCNTCIQLLLKH